MINRNKWCEKPGEIKAKDFVDCKNICIFAKGLKNDVNTVARQQKTIDDDKRFQFLRTDACRFW